MSSINCIINTVKSHFKYPILNSAKFVRDKSTIQIYSQWSSDDIVISKSKIQAVSHHIDCNGNLLSTSIPFILNDDVLCDVFSKDLTKRAIISKMFNKENPKSEEFILNIYDQMILEKSINLTNLDIHGKVLKSNFNFGSYQWSCDNNHFLYMALSKKPKKKSYFDSKAQNSGDIEIGNKYLFTQDFGEQLEDINDELIICNLDLTNEIGEVENSIIDKNEYILGKFFMKPDNPDEMVVLAYKKLPYELGLIYCIQRPSDLFYYNCKSKDCRKISTGSSESAILSPRWSGDGKCVVWLENPVGGAHMQCQRLMKYSFDSNEVEIVYDIVQEAYEKKFPGIHCLDLIENCFIQNDQFVVMASLNRCFDAFTLFNLSNGHVTVLEDPSFPGNINILDIRNDWALLKVSSPSVRPFLALVSLKESIQHQRLKLIPITEKHELPLKWVVNSHNPYYNDKKFGCKPFSSILVAPDYDEARLLATGPRPLIMCLHGGPHSAFRTEYQTFVAAALLCGFCCLLINYRGSWGNGQNNIEALLGNIGTMDVSDCIKATDDITNQYSELLDRNKIHLYGGSHGGFLTVHLAAKYKTQVKSAACRNPVVNLPSMITSSDIPDWVVTEAGLSWQPQYQALLTDNINQMLEKSPISNAYLIDCPVLIMTGKLDKRVPSSQGMELYRHLKSRNVVTQLHVYPDDCHPLSSLDTTTDCMVNVLNWFMTYQ